MECRIFFYQRQTSDIGLHAVGVNCWGKTSILFEEKAAWPNMRAGEVMFFGK